MKNTQITQKDIELMAKELAELSHGNGPGATKKKPFTWSEVREHWAWLVQHADHIKPPKYGANPAVHNKVYTTQVLSLAKQLRLTEQTL